MQTSILLALTFCIPQFHALSVGSTSNRTISKHLFNAFIAAHGRNYIRGSQEYDTRQELFQERVAQVHLHNSNPRKRWVAAVNHFADHTEQELAQYRGWRGVHRSDNLKASGNLNRHSRENLLLSKSTSTLPEEKTWKDVPIIAKESTDQGQCGSCWAVTTATVLTAGAQIRGLGHNFSAQDILDCVPNPNHCGGSGGCDGSTVELAMNWIMEFGGKSMVESPYVGTDQKCQTQNDHVISALAAPQSLEDMTKVGFHGPLSQQSKGLQLGLRGWEHLPENKYMPLLKAVAMTGPVAVSVSATNGWFMYWGGIFDTCSRDAEINHAVTLIGYGKDAESGDKYWIIKNSWGAYWGEQGNIRILRTDSDEEHCGTDYNPKDGTGCNGGPSQVKVCGMCGILYDSVVPLYS
jgi:cathepsin L